VVFSGIFSHNCTDISANEEEITWGFKEKAVVSEARRVRCTRRPAVNAKRNAKFLSSLGKTVRSIARIVSQNAKAPAAVRN
jgi:hypothetical protein